MRFPFMLDNRNPALNPFSVGSEIYAFESAGVISLTTSVREVLAMLDATKVGPSVIQSVPIDVVDNEAGSRVHYDPVHEHELLPVFSYGNVAASITTALDVPSELREDGVIGFIDKGEPVARERNPVRKRLATAEGQ